MKPYYYVYCPEDDTNYGQHDTLSKAVCAAEQLAKENPGEIFEVLRAVCMSQCPEPNVGTFWVDKE